MSAASLINPQSFNLYSYVGNDPINRTDPSGLFWGKLFGFVKKLVKWIKVALAVAIIVLTVWLAPELTGVVIAKMLVMVGLLLGSALGPPWLQTAIAIGVAAVGIYLQNPGAIWNFADPGNGGAAANSGTNLARWLTVLAFGQVPLGVRSKHDRAMEKKHAAEQKDQGLSRCVRNLLGPWFKELDLSKIVLTAHYSMCVVMRRDTRKETTYT